MKHQMLCKTKIFNLRSISQDSQPGGKRAYHLYYLWRNQEDAQNLKITFHRNFYNQREKKENGLFQHN